MRLLRSEGGFLLGIPLALGIVALTYLGTVYTVKAEAAMYQCSLQDKPWSECMDWTPW